MNLATVKILLDTHIWLWYLTGDKRLSTAHRELIEDEAVELWLSPMSVWEAHLLIERGRLPVTLPADEWIRQALRALPVREAQLTFSVAVRSRQIPIEHHDPADRFLAATSAERKIPLLTADERLLSCAAIETVKGRRARSK